MPIADAMVHRIEAHSFFAAGLVPGAHVVDLGAHHGGFALEMIQRYDVRVTAVEADSDAAARIPQDPRLTVLTLAIAPETGTSLLYRVPGRCSTTTSNMVTGPSESELVPAATVEAVLETHGGPEIALMKVDIEGAEAGIFLSTPSSVLRRINQLTVEYHDFIDPHLSDAVEEAHLYLLSTGFRYSRFSRDNTDVLYYREERIGPRLLLRTSAAVLKYTRGLRRISRRAVGRST